MTRIYLWLLLFVLACEQQKNIPPAVKTASTAVLAACDKSIADAKVATDSGRTEIAIGIIETALQLATDSLPEPHAKTAQLHHSLGVLYFRSSQWEKAGGHFQSAVDMRQALLPNQQALATDLAKCYYNLARVQYTTGKQSLSLRSIHRSLEFAAIAQPVDSFFIADCYNYSSLIYQNLGDIQNSLRYSERALSIVNNKPSGNEARLASYCLTISAAYGILGQTENLVFYSNKAQKLHHSLGNKSAEAICLSNLSAAYVKVNNLKAGENALLRALKLNQERLDMEPDNLGVLMDRGHLLANLGLVYKKAGRHEKAIKFGRESLRFVETAWPSKFHPNVANAYNQFGRIMFAAGKTKQALEAYQTAISALVYKFQESNFLKNPILGTASVDDMPLLLGILENKGQALRQLASIEKDSLPYLRAAFGTYRLADTLVIQMSQSYHEDGAKLDLADENVPMYENALQLTYKLWNCTGDTLYRNAAFVFCERNKAGVLLEALNNLRAKHTAGINDKVLEQERTLRQAVAKQEAAIFEAQRGNEQESIQVCSDSLFSLKQKLETLARNMEMETPGLFLQKFALSSAPAPHLLQSRLPQGTALIEYFLGDSTLFTIFISKQSMRLFQSPLPTGFWNLANEYRRSVSDWGFVMDRSVEAEAAYLKSASALFNTLLKEPLDGLAAEGIERLVIIPDGGLSFIPFEALLTKQATSWKQKKLPTLLQQFAVSYAYSSHFLNEKNKKNALRRFVGMGLEYDDRTLKSVNEWASKESEPFSKDTNLLQVMLLASRGGLGKLAYSAKEVSEIADLMGGQCWVNSDATKSNFLRYAPDGGILHFAGHGFTDAQNSMNSFLLFSKTNDSTDCRLYASDVYGLRLDANLVVLSACNTGFGVLNKGEGVMSLARAFAGAGVPSVVMSLWSVTDASTAKIMNQFYLALKKGGTKDKALREAKLEYLNATTPERAIPIYWAGTVLMGDFSPLPISEGQLSWTGFALILFGIGVLAFVLWRWKLNA